MRYLLFTLLVSLSACIQPQGEWEVTRGSDFPEDKVETLEEHESTAGAVIQALGVPYNRKDGNFIYAVRRERPVVRSYLVYQSPFTEEVTLQTTIKFHEGVVYEIASERYERLLPRGE
jgi:hypothetical protein